MNNRFLLFSLFVIFSALAGCANITTPTGGKKDTIPPKLVSIDPPDSMLSTRVTRIEMHFNEYITVNDVIKEVRISPILQVLPTETGKNKTVVVKIIDSLLEPNTTYRLSLGNSIRDLHEANPFPKYTYTFSTGPYFDSMEVHGSVINAATGLPDTGTVLVVLYNATENDSAIVRHKPKYITTADASGNFVFKGLPKHLFRIYALKDANNNLFYDGPAAGELIGFADKVIVPSDTFKAPVKLDIFAEVIDSVMKKILDSAAEKKLNKPASKAQATDVLTYSLVIDTSNSEKRTFDITGYITISFNKQPLLNTDKITLTYDSLGNTVTPSVSLTLDSVTHRLKIKTDWQENRVYKLRLVKGFARDSAGVEVVPARFVFRTKSAEDDYGKLTLDLPPKYLGPGFLLSVKVDNDSVYLRPITDTVVTLTRLKPGKYTVRVIVDKNRNGKWDTGDLLAHRQPEVVIPYREAINIKSGFYNIIDDFDPKPLPVQDTTKNGATPK